MKQPVGSQQPLISSEETQLKQPVGSQQPLLSSEETQLKQPVGSQQPLVSPEETPLKQLVGSSRPPLHVMETTVEVTNIPTRNQLTNQDQLETSYKSRPCDYNLTPNQDLCQINRLPGRSLSEHHKNPSEPESLHYQQQTLEELNSFEFHPQASQEYHLLSITPSLVPDDLEEATTPLEKFEVTFILDRLVHYTCILLV